MDVTSIAAARAEVERAKRAELARRYPERLYRALGTAIDAACLEVEEVILAGGGECPGRAGALIEYLLLLAGAPVERPGTSAEALEVLFQLSATVLGRGCQIDPGSGAVSDRVRGSAA
jgi:hypothetical protein